jgi:caudovirus prohead protease|uniref:Major capsid protein n=1 Tax=Siphoviridae sp. ctSWe10 TaxID=2826344 RepID=A0A8S5NSE0_9CAUD|nr:MAG TPA: major capsid protein [Siphoviridae sp. ctSWe10]
MDYDFCGWATRNNIQCSDGRIIRKDAFKSNDGQKVPLVWNHQHNDPTNILGHAMLENREEGVYAYCTFNNTDAAKDAKSLVEHGDISSLSIYANKLKQNGPNVMHGQIREVSLVLAGANPEAFIENVISHGEDSDDEAIMYFGEDIELEHSDDTKEEVELKKENKKMAEKSTPEKDDRTIGDVFDTLTEDQKTAVYAIIGQILEDNGIGKDSEEDDKKMKHNVFEGDNYDTNDTLSHSDMQAIISDAKRYGSMKDAVLAHGIEHIDYLFPEAANVENMPSFIQRDMTWVGEVMNAVHHTPFSRIKSTFANITEDDARAKGYIKGKKKKDEVFSLLKRTTSPTTIYKKQKLDRDDVVDITDFDVVAWLKSEMRMMLDEEIARAILVGDGRLSSSDDKINEQNIRPIYTDDSLYTIREQIKFSATATADEKAKSFIRQSIKARKEYKGSGSPILYTTEDVLTDCLLLEDTTGRIIYDTVEKLATALRVKKIVTVPVMEGYKKTGEDSKEYSLMGIIVNLADYNVGADKGGAVNMFDDFDIDYNAQKYLIETRCSGALIKPYSAIVIEATTE